MYTQKDIFIVTGATSGIGKGVVLSLLDKGAKVIAIGRDTKKLISLKKEAINKNNLILEEKDLSNCRGLDKWILSITKKYGKLKGLILSAGIQQIIPISSPLSVEKSKELFEINYFSTMQIAKGFCDRRANIGKGSSVIFISSIASIRGNAGIIGYAASKGAINSGVKSLALEVSKLGIRVNAVLPGFVKTEMTSQWKEIYNKQYLEKLNKEYPLGIGKVENVIGPILFLLSDESKWITGNEIIVDGGASL
ncbi:SDR family oxidoreductase [Pelagibacterales bacterium SAG-MED22]|nr:SDR family oxidoreductase [Pelagibacterales bacterium SAG-MED22]